MFPTASPSALSSADIYCSPLRDHVLHPYPTRAIAACGNAESKYESACACRPTPSCTPTPSVIGPNGKFAYNGIFSEKPIRDDWPWPVNTRNLLPWLASVRILGVTTYALGPRNHSFNYAFETTQTGEKNPYGEFDTKLFQMEMPLEVGKSYELKYAVWFSQNDAGRVAVAPNEVPIGDVLPLSSGCCNWVERRVHFVTLFGYGPPHGTYIVFDFYLSAIGVTHKLDDVFVTPL
ncbi:MAG: hypothetical protein M1833_004375 [Piccolia ochrophora]|nr:MAG: hypothetical protein M1833_004375 [Piccolia ochrophora]